MNISDLLQLQKKKAALQKKKQNLLKKQLNKKRLQQINLDHSSVKKGYIEKTKIIKKQQFQNVKQKARTHIPIQIQQNASVSSYLINNSNYQKIYERTKKIIRFQQEQNFSNSLMALKSFAEENHQKILHLKLVFEKQIDCRTVIRPFQLDLPNKINIDRFKKHPLPKAIILVNDAKTVQKSANFKNILNDFIWVKSYSQMIKQWRNDKQLKKKVSKNRILILCDWQIYKNSNKFIQNLMKNNFIVFPFDVKKVPYFVQQKYNDITYDGYLDLMLQNQYCLIKSGKQHTVHLKLNKNVSVQQLSDNVKEAIIQSVAKLIQRTKDKGNSLVQAQIKSNTSINFVIYKK